MAKMHVNERQIDENIVRKLIKNQCPHLANLPLKTIISSGTDHALFRLGNDYVIRLPRIEWMPGSIIKNINKEYKWLPKIAPLLKTPISAPVFKGEPDNDYPWPWTITKWYEGHNPAFEKDNEYALLAKDLACFLNELHEIKLAHGSNSRRGVHLKEMNKETKKAIGELEGEVDTQSITSVWDQVSRLSPWGEKSVWIHGDFLPGNILVQNNRLNAVIDFSDVGMGDPACDLIISWSLFNAQSRKTFRENLKNTDDNTWERGRGWALSIAVIMLSYYKNSNPVLTMLARRLIEAVIMK